jgi:hypothetical protein
MNKYIEIKNICTPYGNFSIGTFFNNEKLKIAKKLHYNYMNENGWALFNNNYIPSVTCHGNWIDIKDFIESKELDIDIVDNILFYPDENKIEIISKKKIMQIIVSDKYSIVIE